MNALVMTLLPAIAVGSVAGGATASFVVWIVKTVIGERMRSEMRAEYDARFETLTAHLKSDADPQIEHDKAATGAETDPAIDPARQHGAVIGAIFPGLIRLHEAVHRCAYPADDPNNAAYQRHLDDMAHKAIDLNIEFHSRRPLLHIDTVRKIDEITSRVTMITASRGRRQVSAPVTSLDRGQQARPSAGILLVTRTHLMALEQDVRALVGEIAESRA
jgi:hypothetical protein